MDELEKIRAAMIAGEALSKGTEYGPGERTEQVHTIRLDKTNALYFPAPVVRDFALKPSQLVRVFFTDDHNIVLIAARDGSEGFKFRRVVDSDDYLKLTLPKKAIVEHGLTAGTAYDMVQSAVDVGGSRNVKAFVLQPKEEKSDE